LFYDSPERCASTRDIFETARRWVPPGWTREEETIWTHCRPPDAILPRQGWKIHISACPHNADRVLSVAWDYCTGAGIHFKFLTAVQSFLAVNSKHAPRGSAGKFITIYPVSVGQCAVILDRLGELLRGEPGPEIPGDLRWAGGPLHVRYGGFQRRYCRHEGRLVRAVEAPDGRLVPDEDGPWFRPPSWVGLPDFLAAHLAAREDRARREQPYRLERVLGLSYGTSVYLARGAASGRMVVVKQARPFAGLDADGSDALTRQQREWDALTAGAGLDAVPAAVEFVRDDDRGLLVQGYVEGITLDKAVARRHPIASSAEPGERARYAAWALTVIERVEAAVAALHARGIVFGDLHPGNVVVGPDDHVTLVDFESAFRIGQPRRAGLGYPGFAPPPEVSGADVDRYALACLRLFAFAPLTCLVPFDAGKARQLAEAARELFDVPVSAVEPAAAVLTGAHPRAPRAEAAQAEASQAEAAQVAVTDSGAIDSMVAAILESATPERADRLFPGDVIQFHLGGCGFAYGAAGVLYALHAAGCQPRPEHVDWLVSGVRRERNPRAGFYDGLHGIAYLLARLGRLEDAVGILDTASRLGSEHLGPDLFSGFAGIGLTLLSFSEMTGDPAYLRRAVELGRVLADAPLPDDARGRQPAAGLMRGASGVALFFLHLFDTTGDARYLRLAAEALRRDLSRCTTGRAGGLYVARGSGVLLSHLSAGSAGIACVLDAYLLRRHDDELASASEALKLAVDAPFHVHSGLFNGRAGAILCGTGGSRGAAVPAHLRRLRWHALNYRGHLAFPGDRLLRLSMDLGTGTAGVLLAVVAATTADPVHLPFLMPARPAPATVPATTAPATATSANSETGGVDRSCI
jgi:Protein kinase domain/Lanthionine synthetase C-like protein